MRNGDTQHLPPFDKGMASLDALRNHLPQGAVSAGQNDHLGFEVLYVYRGVVRKYRPDFLVRLLSGDILILETKGQDTEQDRVKRRYLGEWTQAVNAHGGFGRWSWAVAHHPGEIKDILLKYAT